MALSEKMIKFAQAIADGMSNKDAAISAGYSEKSASQQGSKLICNAEILVYIEKLKADKKGESLTSKKLKNKPSSSHEDDDPDKDEYPQDDPLEFLVAVMNNSRNDMFLRVNAAKSALPYIHGKVAEKGKKETKAEEARNNAKSGGKFGTLGSQLKS